MSVQYNLCLDANAGLYNWEARAGLTVDSYENWLATEFDHATRGTTYEGTELCILLDHGYSVFTNFHSLSMEHAS